MSARIRTAGLRARFFLLPALVISGCLVVEPPGALKSQPADGSSGTAGNEAVGTGGSDAASGASGKSDATAGSGGRVSGASGDLPVGDASGAAGESGGGSATGGAGGGTAGQNSGGMHAGGTNNGGTNSGGTNSGGTNSGGTNSGGTNSGGTNSGGTHAGGTNSGGTAGAGGTAGPALPGPGCTATDGLKTLTTGGASVASGLATSTLLTINSGGAREYVIDVPADYNPKHPYRLIFSWHQAYGSDVANANGTYPANPGPNFDASHYAFFGLRREVSAANDSAIFVAPKGIGDTPWDFTRDSVLFDDLLALIDSQLCIDEKRVFSVGFSLGALMTYGLSITRQTKLRAVVVMSGVNYNLPGEPTDTNAAPVAYFGTTGMSDTICPWGSDTKGGKACNLVHARDNGCTIPASIPTTTVGSKTSLCYDFSGCAAGYPVKVCTFDGGHTPSSVDNGTSIADDGLNAFIPPLAWDFIAQF